MAEIKKKIKLTEYPKISVINVTEDRDIHLEWTSVKFAEKYVITRSTSYDGEYTVIDRTTELSFTDTTAQSDTCYWYKIVAWRWLDEKKGSSTKSAAKPATISDIPAVTNLKAEKKDGMLCLTWDKSGDDEYIVYKRSDHFTRIMYLGRTKDNFICDSLPVAGQVNHYAVQKVTPSDENELYGKISEEADYVFIDKTEIRSLRKIIGKKALINVRVIAGADGYIFERCEKKDGDFTEIGRTTDITAVNLEDKLPARFTTYGFRVCAYKKVGNKEFKGKYSEIKYIKI